MADDYEDELLVDNMAGLANAMIILTGILLVIGIILMWKVTGNLYGEGVLGN